MRMRRNFLIAKIFLVTLIFGTLIIFPDKNAEFVQATPYMSPNDVEDLVLDFQTNQELLARLQSAEESAAHKITIKSEKQFQAKGYKAASIVLRGGAAESILAAAKEYQPDIIALGSKGLSGIEFLLLGSVAERVARYVKCSVLIGRGVTKTANRG